MRSARIVGTEYVLPERCESNVDLAQDFVDWDADRVFAKTGIAHRRLAAADECSSDLAVRAAQKLFASGICSPEEIDFVLFCTQTPDYILPTTACLIQNRLGIPQIAGALDFNLGCSGYVYGLSLAKGLIESGQARSVLFLTADTYSKMIDPKDRNVRVIFGDGGTATLLQETECDTSALGPFVFGTDGAGAEHFIVETGGFRQPISSESKSESPSIHMNGPEIFNFTLRVVPDCVARLLARAGKTLADIEMVVAHQANSFMLEHLRRKLDIPKEKFFIGMRDCGNTVSSSIPIALKELAAANQLTPGATVMVLGFGVGYSWGGGLITWQP